ncbi:hypothetical protein SAMN04489841_1081 [Natrinema salaciae]|uniref:Uncharacterized protein n=1 Tax=Natrinema salaciae TaxID=1186196 RepID=A0A1H9CKR3_9EURY|nr:hypothetical protein SAMN04489841_1081 [Natrinema salaciae]
MGEGFTVLANLQKNQWQNMAIRDIYKTSFDENER